MEKRVAKFRTFEETEKADCDFYRSLSPQERLDILLELVERGNRGAPEGFERVYRVRKLGDP